MSRLYQVQSIRDHKEVDGQLQYLIHWKRYGDDHDTWEPLNNLKDCDEIIEEYERKRKRESTPKRSQRTKTVPLRRSSRLAMQNTAPAEVKAPHGSDNTEDTDNATDQAPAEAEKKEDLVKVEEKKKTQQLKRRSQPNMMVAENASKENKDKKRVYKRHSHASLVATGDLVNSVADKMYRTYDLRQRVQPMEPPSHPVPSSSILLSSDEEAEILARHPVRKGRSPHRKIGVAPDPVQDSEKSHTTVKSFSKYKVSVQEGNLLVRKEAKEPTEAATYKEDEGVKPAEPIISDVEEEETVTPSQVVVSAAATSSTSTFPPPPKWMYLNSAEFLLALLLTALLFVTYWCWNSDVC